MTSIADKLYTWPFKCQAQGGPRLPGAPGSAIDILITFNLVMLRATTVDNLLLLVEWNQTVERNSSICLILNPKIC